MIYEECVHGEHERLNLRRIEKKKRDKYFSGESLKTNPRLKEPRRSMIIRVHCSLTSSVVTNEELYLSGFECIRELKSENGQRK